MKDKVIFRKDRTKDGSVFALFPLIATDRNGYYCQSYQHIGQHSGADYAGCVRASRPAKPSEYKDLARELRGRGYRLQVIQRAPLNAYEVRRAMAKA